MWFNSFENDASGFARLRQLGFVTLFLLGRAMRSARRRNLSGRYANGTQAVRNLIGLCSALFLALVGVGGPAVADEARPNRMQIEYVPP